MATSMIAPYLCESQTKEMVTTQMLCVLTCEMSCLITLRKNLQGMLCIAGMNTLNKSVSTAGASIIKLFTSLQVSHLQRFFKFLGLKQSRKAILLVMTKQFTPMFINRRELIRNHLVEKLQILQKVLQTFSSLSPFLEI